MKGVILFIVLVLLVGGTWWLWSHGLPNINAVKQTFTVPVQAINCAGNDTCLVNNRTISVIDLTGNKCCKDINTTIYTKRSDCIAQVENIVDDKYCVQPIVKPQPWWQFWAGWFK